MYVHTYVCTRNDILQDTYVCTTYVHPCVCTVHMYVSMFCLCKIVSVCTEMFLLDNDAFLVQNTLMSELKTRVEELRMENEYQLRLKDMNHNEKVKEMSDKFQQEMEALKAKYSVSSHTYVRTYVCAYSTHIVYLCFPMYVHTYTHMYVPTYMYVCAYVGIAIGKRTA